MRENPIQYVKKLMESKRPSLPDQIKSEKPAKKARKSRDK